ncbi:MAG: GNAT family N-acetyltransferase [Bacteriovorax sp.]|nr:GNAT family N-acetyltransferase [Bacteriovorax sp.]
MITPVLLNRYKTIFKTSMTSKQKKDLVFLLEESFVRGRLVLDVSPNGKLAWFFQFKLSFMGEFEEEFFHITTCYCSDSASARKTFYKAIETSAKSFKQFYKMKRMAIDISFDDEASKKYFLKKGIMTYIELVGMTSTGLKALDKIVQPKSSFKFSRMKAEDVNKLIELDLQSHISDKSSRMRTLFMKKNAKKNMQQFYGALLKHNACVVAKDGKKLAGDIGYFIDQENKRGLIACIFVANEFKGKKLSFELYQKVLQDFKKKKLVHYIGATTTDGVLASAMKMGRMEFKRVYLLKI